MPSRRSCATTAPTAVIPILGVPWLADLVLQPRVKWARSHPLGSGRQPANSAWSPSPRRKAGRLRCAAG